MNKKIEKRLEAIEENVALINNKLISVNVEGDGYFYDVDLKEVVTALIEHFGLRIKPVITKRRDFEIVKQEKNAL